MIRLSKAKGFPAFLLLNLSKDGEKVIDDHLVQVDYDYVGVAQTFGMKLRHKPKCPDQSFTDGTVDCPECGQKASEFIAQAEEYLDNHIGKEVPDPGYFDLNNSPYFQRLVENG